MTVQVLVFYIIGGFFVLLGAILGLISGFTSTEWWCIGFGAVMALVGLFVQLGWLNPPLGKKSE